MWKYANSFGDWTNNQICITQPFPISLRIPWKIFWKKKKTNTQKSEKVRGAMRIGKLANNNALEKFQENWHALEFATTKKKIFEKLKSSTLWQFHYKPNTIDWLLNIFCAINSFVYSFVCLLYFLILFTSSYCCQYDTRTRLLLI